MLKTFEICWEDKSGESHLVEYKANSVAEVLRDGQDLEFKRLSVKQL